MAKKLAKLTNQSIFHTDKKGRPRKTPQAVDEALKNNDDFNFLLNTYHELTESILSLAMEYVDRKNALRNQRKNQQKRGLTN